MGTESLPE